MIDDTDCFPALNSKFEFIGMDEKNPSMMIVRKHWKDQELYTLSKKGLLDVHSVDIDILKKHGLWDKIRPEVQKEIENLTKEQKDVVCNLLEKARGSRKAKYKDVPRFLDCIKCHAKIPIAPGLLVKKVEKIALVRGIAFTLDTYIKEYKCNKCNPFKRGRKANPDNAGYPKTLTCSCGKKVNTNATALRNVAERRKITVDEYVKGYRCQGCVSTRGQHFRKKGRCGKK